MQGLGAFKLSRLRLDKGLSETRLLARKSSAWILLLAYALLLGEMSYLGVHDVLTRSKLLAGVEWFLVLREALAHLPTNRDLALFSISTHI